MRSITKNKIKYVLFVISALLLGSNAVGQNQDELATLQVLQQTWQKKIHTLKREQDFLLFQNEMYAVDSKYLLLNITARSGQLKYKNRVLKDFRFIPVKNVNDNALQPGMLVLTSKTERKLNRYALIFGTSLIIQWTRSAAFRQGGNIPAILLSENDILSVFSAVEEGARAYIVQ